MKEELPGHRRLEQPEQVRRPVQDVRVRRQGPAARRRPLVRHERRRARQEPQPQLRGRRRRQRGGAHHLVPAGDDAEDPAPRLLLRPAVGVVPGAAARAAARPDQAARVHGRLRRRPGEGRLRLPAVRPRQDRQHDVRDRGRRGLRADQELQVVEPRPEHGLRVHRQPGDVAGGCGQEVGRGERGDLVRLDAVGASRAAPEAPIRRPAARPPADPFRRPAGATAAETRGAPRLTIPYVWAIAGVRAHRYCRVTTAGRFPMP